MEVERRVLAGGSSWLATDPAGTVVGFAVRHGRLLEHRDLRPDQRREASADS